MDPSPVRPRWERVSECYGRRMTEFDRPLPVPDVSSAAGVQRQADATCAAVAGSSTVCLAPESRVNNSGPDLPMRTFSMISLSLRTYGSTASGHGGGQTVGVAAGSGASSGQRRAWASNSASKRERGVGYQCDAPGNAEVFKKLSEPGFRYSILWWQLSWTLGRRVSDTT